MVKVYIVDDSVLFVGELMLTVPWEKLGAQVVGSAHDADTAERDIREKRPDIVITDIAMPRRDGLNLIESLQDLQDIEYILVSAYPRFEYALKAIKLKIADYFLKPFDDEEFNQAIERVIQKVTSGGKARRSELQMKIALPDASNIQNHYLVDAIRYMDEHYAEELSSAQMAQMLYISESYLGKLFRRNLNVSFTEYLNYIRIRKAMVLLKSSDMMVYEVAECVGFSDYRYFATMFRKYTGISPSQYKSSLRG